MTVTEFPGGVRVEGAEPFDLAQTLDCGQCFRFAPTGDGGWFGAAGGHAAGLRFEGESLVLEGATAAEFEGFWRDYLDLDRDYAAVRAGHAVFIGLSCLRIDGDGLPYALRDLLHGKILRIPEIKVADDAYGLRVRRPDAEHKSLAVLARVTAEKFTGVCRRARMEPF